LKPFNDIRVIPLAAATVSLEIPCMLFFVASNPPSISKRRNEARHSEGHTYSFLTIFGFMLAHLIGSVTLSYLSTATLKPCEKIQFGQYPEAFSYHPIREFPASCFLAAED
jgi:hypothetical protein